MYGLNDVGKEAFDDFRKVDIGDIVGLTGFVFKNSYGRNFHPLQRNQVTVKVFTSSTRKIPWFDQSGTQIPSALCGFDYEPGNPPDI